MPDEPRTPDEPERSLAPTPAASPWSTEHYGFPPAPAAAPAPTRASMGPPSVPAPSRAGQPVVAGAKPWWNKGRTLAAAGVAAAIFAVGAIGFTVGHAAADGPRDTVSVNAFDPGQGGPGGRDARGTGR